MRSILKRTFTTLFMTTIFIQCLIISCDKINVEALTTGTNVSDDIIIEGLNEYGELELNLDDNNTKTLVLNSENYQVTSCSNWGGRNTFSTMYNWDTKECTLNAKHYGKERLDIYLWDPINQVNLEKRILVDIDTENYVRAAFNLMPDTYVGSMYNTSDLYEKAIKIIPEDIYYNYDYNQCYTEGNNYNCNLEIGYYYNDINNISQKIAFSKPITFVSPQLPELSTYELNIGATSEINLNISNDINRDDLVFVSLDNSVASITKNGKIKANGYGETEIRLYNKQTMNYTRGTVRVKEVRYGSIDQLLNDFNGKTITIDANALTDNWINYQEAAMQYFRDLAKYLPSSIYISPEYPLTTCNDNKCVVGFTYAGQQRYTEEITINIEGIAGPEKVYIPVGHNFQIRDYVTSYEDGEITLRADENYIKYTTERNCEYRTTCDENGENCTTEEFNCQEHSYYKPLQVGEVEVEFIIDGHIKKITFVITHSDEDENLVRTQLNNLDSITLPYSRMDFNNNLQYLNSIVTSNVKPFINNENLNKYLNYRVNCLFTDRCTINVEARVEQHHLASFGTKTIKINYSGLDNENSEIINELKRVNEAIEDEYVLSFRDTVILENTYLSDEDFYANLITKTNINDIILNSLLDISIEQVETKLFTSEIKGGTVYKLIIKHNDVILQERLVTVSSNHIYYMEGFTSEKDEARINCIKNQIDGILSINSTITKVVNNVYEVDLGTKKFNMIFDQREIIKISYVNLQEQAVELNAGDIYEIQYTVYPLMANTGTIKFSSANEDVATVDQNGIVTAVGKGYTAIKLQVGYSSTTLLVAVNTSIEEILNDIINELPNHVTIDYSMLNYNDLNNAIASKLQDSLYELNLNYMSIWLEVIEENEKHYVTSRYYVGNGEYLYSDKKEVTYDIVGIRIKENEVEIVSNEEFDQEIFFSEGNIKNLYYEVSDESIATISDTGVITGLKPGLTYVNVFDKYNKYYNWFKVIVDKELFYETTMNELHSKPIVLKGDLFTTYGSWQDYEQIINNMFQNEISKYISLYDYADTTQTICNTTAMKCTIYLSNYGENWVIEDNWTEEFDIEFDGIFVSSAEIELEKGIEEDLDFEVFPSNAEVTIESLNTNLCEITNNTKVKTKENGICPLKYTTEEHVSYQFVIIDKDEIKTNIQNSYNDVSSTINLNVEKYDPNIAASFGEEDYEGMAEYIGYYDAGITGHIDNELNIPYTYWHGFNLDNIDENDELDVNISAYYNFQDKNREFYYSYDFYEEFTKKFKLIFGEVPEEEKIIGEEVKEHIKTNYDLTLEQTLKYQLSNDNFENLHKYSSLLDDIKEVCSDCTYRMAKTVGGGGGGEDSAGMSFPAVIYRNGYPIASKWVNTTIYFNIDTGESNSIEDVLESIEEEVRQTYLEVKNSSLTQATPLMTRGNNVFKPVTANDNIEVEVTKESTDETGKGTYKIRVEEIQFKAVIDTSSKQEGSYSNNVTGIKTKIKTLNLKVDETNTIEYEITPANADDVKVSWSSSNNNIATVDEYGKVTAKSIGKATITVKTNDGGFTAEVTVNVTLNDSVVTLLGDVNLDNVINMNDLITLRKQQAGLVTFNDKALANADMNNDSRVNMTDVIQLRKYLAK